MKNLCVLLCLVLSLSLNSQSTFAVKDASYSKSELALKSLSARKVGVGAKLVSTLNGTQVGLQDNIFLSGKIIYDASVAGLKIPIVSNVNIDFSSGDGGFLNGDKGISIGIYPYRVLSEGNITTVLHGGLAYKLLPGESSFTAQQTKIFAGLEFEKKIMESSYPITLSITPLYTFNNLEADNFFGLETTAIIPVSGGLGILAEYNAPFVKTVDSAFRLGIIVFTALR